MYEIYTVNKKVEKNLKKYIKLRKDIPSKLDRLRINPRKELGAHMLHGKLIGRWACWLGGNIRITYIIDDREKKIKVLGIGSHKIY